MRIITGVPLTKAWQRKSGPREQKDRCGDRLNSPQQQSRERSQHPQLKDTSSKKDKNKDQLYAAHKKLTLNIKTQMENKRWKKRLHANTSN